MSNNVPPEVPIEMLKFKCPNEVCTEEIRTIQPRAEKVQSRYFSAIVLPAMRFTCKKCGSVIQIGIGDFNFELEAVVLGKVDVPRIIKPS